MQLGPGKFFGEMAFFHEGKRRASVRASEHETVEVLALSYAQLSELLDQSEVTRDWLQQKADRHERENAALRGVTS
jgi:CRP-like cAMP-binding protein